MNFKLGNEMWRWIHQHDTSMGQRKILSCRQESNPWPPEHRPGALSAELRELMESTVRLLWLCSSYRLSKEYCADLRDFDEGNLHGTVTLLQIVLALYNLQVSVTFLQYFTRSVLVVKSWPLHANSKQHVHQLPNDFLLNNVLFQEMSIPPS